MRFRRQPAYRVYLLENGLSSLFFAFAATYASAFAVEDARLNPLQLVLLGTALEGSTLLAQVPTGLLADVYSRRGAMLCGYALIGCGFIVWGATQRFEIILLAQVLWGAGYACVSGAEEAWISGEIGDERAGAALLRAGQAGLVGAIAGIILAAPLIHFGLSSPLIAGGCLYLVLDAWLFLVMPETPRGRTSGSRPSLRLTLFASLRAVRGSSILITILLITAVYGAASEGFDRLSAAHFIRDIGLPPLHDLDRRIWFSVLSLGGLLLSLLAAEVVRRRIDTSSHRAVAALLAVLNLALCLAVVAFAAAGSFAPALAAYWLVTLLRRTTEPLRAAWLLQNVQPQVRATVFSMASQADAFGQVAGGPLIGLLAAAVSIRAGIAASSLFLVPALLLYALTLRSGPAAGAREPAVIKAPER